MSAPFDLKNISEKKNPFFRIGKKKKNEARGGGEGVGGLGCVRTFDLFFSYGEKVNYLIHGGGVGRGGAAGVAIKWNGPRTLQRRE